MKALDTNVLIRFLVRDDEKQAQAVKKILVEVEKENGELFIPLSVTLEMLWVLSSVYEYPQEDIIRALETLLVTPVFKIEKHERISHLCRIAGKGDYDLADILIGLTSRDNGCDTTLTFDKKAVRSGLFTLIQ